MSLPPYPLPSPHGRGLGTYALSLGSDAMSCPSYPPSPSGHAHRTSALSLETVAPYFATANNLGLAWSADSHNCLNGAYPGPAEDINSAVDEVSRDPTATIDTRPRVTAGLTNSLPVVSPSFSARLETLRDCAGCRHKEQTIAALLNTGSSSLASYGPTHHQPEGLTTGAPKRRKRRGRFTDEQKRKETAATRRIGACTRCREWKKARKLKSSRAMLECTASWRSCEEQGGPAPLRFPIWRPNIGGVGPVPRQPRPRKL
jgi:hypothetical protein